MRSEAQIEMGVSRKVWYKFIQFLRMGLVILPNA
jgi:hypothetical protein